MEALLPVLQRHPGMSVLVCALMFRVAHRLLQQLPVPKVVAVDDFRSWKWRNLAVSLVHSLLTGTWAVTCVIMWPEMATNIHSFYTAPAYMLICISSGYFVQDAGDIILTGHARGSWEFLIHHVLVLWCFLYALYSQIYVSGAVVALFVEVNSVTLHLRLMLKLAAQQSSTLYQINKFLNLFTYVFFRLSAQFYITYYIVRNYSWLERGGYFLVTMILMNIMILVYFYRLLRADFFPRNRASLQRNGTHTNNVKRFLTE
ncbi:TLC domain-containing protein 1 [Esox lucius]|uniref:TLC domain-containing protein n=1 Tax=Esox lucius TaxID=8010 RepID=A0AAY5L9L1_ESOLU|nr:TLC domain-containing protein 1 [Esox lucius]XP_019908885.1 TLC domain-containing protein 1 [Esox lucius]XP_034149625.1 TLC domain-containing protein 1 [Esox lucius]